VSRLAPESDVGEPDAGSTVTDAPAEVPAPTARHAEIVAVLRDALGEGFIAHHYSARDAWVRVAPGSWREAGRVCRERLGLTYLCFISGIDWKQAPDLGGQKRWDPEADATDEPGDGPGRWVTGLAGGETRFQVFARLADLVRHVGLTLKVDAGDGPVTTDGPVGSDGPVRSDGPVGSDGVDAGRGGSAPRAESWVPLFRGADWHERETWEMYGVEFDGHPGLRHLYLPGEFEGFPLRKDFPLLAREVKPWPGLVNVEGLPGEDEPTESGDVEPE
jgi:NADH-quinone oxidoreductase subunit C